MSLHDTFVLHYIDDPLDMESYWRDAIGMIQAEAVSKGIEFDGYFKERWSESADTISEFNEEYFDNEDRRKLYVYLSALYDSEIYNHLKDAYQVVHQPAPTEQDLQNLVDELKLKGIKF